MKHWSWYRLPRSRSNGSKLLPFPRLINLPAGYRRKGPMGPTTPLKAITLPVGSRGRLVLGTARFNIVLVFYYLAGHHFEPMANAGLVPSAMRKPVPYCCKRLPQQVDT